MSEGNLNIIAAHSLFLNRTSSHLVHFCFRFVSCCSATTAPTHTSAQFYQGIEDEDEHEGNGCFHVNIVILYPTPVVFGIGWDEVVIANLSVVFDEVCCPVHSTCILE